MDSRNAENAEKEKAFSQPMQELETGIRHRQGAARLRSLDILKGLSCLAVVAIHYNFTGSLSVLGEGIKAFCRFAVPVFFAVSGYFLVNDELRFTDDAIVRKTRHIARMLAGCFVFFSAFVVLHQCLMNGSFDWSSYVAGKLTAGKIVKFFLTNDPFEFSHLWFLLALLYCYLFSMLVLQNGKRLRFLWLLIPLGLTVMIGQEFPGLLPTNSVLIP